MGFKRNVWRAPNTLRNGVALSTTIFFCGGRQKKDFRYYHSRGVALYFDSNLFGMVLINKTFCVCI